jgi:hypothetical protein
VKAPDIHVAINRLLLATNTEDDLTALQLRNILSDFELILSQAIKVAPCDHVDGPRWYQRGKTMCGICSREVPDAQPV